MRSDFNIGSMVSDSIDIFVMISDGSSSDTDSATITVNNLDPSLTAVSFSTPDVDEGDSATLTGSYTDPGVPDTHMLLIDWDNNGSWDQTESVSGGSFSISHQFPDDHPATGTPSDALMGALRPSNDWASTCGVSPPSNGSGLRRGSTSLGSETSQILPNFRPSSNRSSLPSSNEKVWRTKGCMGFVLGCPARVSRMPRARRIVPSTGARQRRDAQLRRRVQQNSNFILILPK